MTGMMPQSKQCESKAKKQRKVLSMMRRRPLQKKDGTSLYLIQPWVFGPNIYEAPSVEQLGFSQDEFYNVLVKGSQSDVYLRETGMSYIDVRDLAEAHVLALEKQEAGGERIIVAAGPYKWQDWLDAANALCLLL